MPPVSPSLGTALPGSSRFSLGEVISTHELDERPTRPPEFEAENIVLQKLATALALAPDHVLQELVDSARTLCKADSAGISLLDGTVDASGEEVFRWIATSGGLGSYFGNTMPRGFSPCGAVLDAGCTLLMSDPARHYPYMDVLSEPVREVLLVPFYRGATAIGTVWICSHAEHRFDREDARLVKSLSQFAAAAVQVIEKNAAAIKVECTARHMAEAELLEMTELHRKAAQADRDQSEFLATLSHELRNTLSPIRHALTIIKLSPERDVRSSARELLERQFQQLTRLVDDLLDSSRLASGKLSLECEVEDLSQVVREAVEAARSRVEASQQTLGLVAPTDPLIIRCDKLRLAQVFGNLLANATKYGSAGGHVQVTVERREDSAVVRVKDAGIGIDAVMLPRIFGLFVQAGPVQAHSQGGLGIGLSLVKHLVELHGGTVEARSPGTGKGSEFIITLPLVVLT